MHLKVIASFCCMSIDYDDMANEQWHLLVSNGKIETSNTRKHTFIHLIHPFIQSFFIDELHFKSNIIKT